jgi:hypothetical protein
VQDRVGGLEGGSGWVSSGVNGWPKMDYLQWGNWEKLSRDGGGGRHPFRAEIPTNTSASVWRKGVSRQTKGEMEQGKEIVEAAGEWGEWGCFSLVRSQWLVSWVHRAGAGGGPRPVRTARSISAEHTAMMMAPCVRLFISNSSVSVGLVWRLWCMDLGED